MQFNKQDILDMLAVDDKAVGRALVALKKRQTPEERTSYSTRSQNGRGFMPGDARPGQGMAEYFEKRGTLTPAQLAYWRAPIQRCPSRIAAYWAQLLEEANERAAQDPTIVVKVRERVRQLIHAKWRHSPDPFFEDARPAKMERNDSFRARRPDEDVGNYEEERMVHNEIHPDELEMMRMEAEGDREQTIREEMNKQAARAAMEGDDFFSFYKKR